MTAPVRSPRRAPPPLALTTAVVVLAVFVSAGSAVAVGSGPAEEQALRIAGRAAERVSFKGVLQMRWFEGTTERHETMVVEAANGSVMVRGGSAALASPSQRLVEHDGRWDLLWPVSKGGPDRPNPGEKYEVSSAAETTVANRPARVVEFRAGGALLERLFLDAETDLLLRREQFDGGTSPSRTIGFDTLKVGGTDAPNMPDKVKDQAAKPVTGDDLPPGVSAPVSLPDSYHRLGVYRRSGVTQVLYSDGLYDLSVFQQEGRLDRSELPGGHKVRIGNRTGWHYGWAGGHVVVWEARGVVHTAVSDAPVAQVVAASASIPTTGGSASLLVRLRQVCRALVQPLG